MLRTIYLNLGIFLEIFKPFHYDSSKDPLSLSRTLYGFQINETVKSKHLSHLMCMEDIRLYGFIEKLH